MKRNVELCFYRELRALTLHFVWLWTESFPSVYSLYAKLGELGVGCSFVSTFSFRSQQASKWDYFPKYQTICSYLYSMCQFMPRHFKKRFPGFTVIIYNIWSVYTVSLFCLFAFRASVTIFFWGGFCETHIQCSMIHIAFFFLFQTACFIGDRMQTHFCRSRHQVRFGLCLTFRFVDSPWNSLYIL